MTLGKGQEMTLTFSTYIFINTIIFRSQAAIVFDKSTFSYRKALVAKFDIVVK